VAAPAIRAELAVMDVVGSMAGAAVAVHGPHLGQRIAVAVIAGNFAVRALERERRLRVMIEKPDVPCDRVVTILATLGEVATVRIGLQVASRTSGFCRGESLRGMAVFALLFRVRSEQREIREVVVKEHRVLPVDIGVAAFAHGAERTLVRIVVGMARIAGRRERYLENWFDMAVVACNLDMGTGYPVVRVPVMVEG